MPTHDGSIHPGLMHIQEDCFRQASPFIRDSVLVATGHDIAGTALRSVRHGPGVHLQLHHGLAAEPCAVVRPRSH